MDDLSETEITDVIFSGDLVNNPCDDKIYDQLIDKFLSKLSDKTKIGLENFIFRPGNHDISFDELKEQSTLGGAIRKGTSESRVSDQDLMNEEHTNYAYSVSSEFFSALKSMGTEWNNPYYHIYRLSGGEKVIALNSAFGCSPEGSKAEQGKLHVPTDGFWNTLPERDFLAAVFHHPLGSLNENSQRELGRRIRHDTKAAFFGHVHDPLPMHNIAPDSQQLFFQSAAISQRDDRFQGYCILDIEQGESKAKFRTFFEARGEFDGAINVATSGIVFFPSEIFQSGQTKLVSLQSDLSEDLSNDFDDNLVDKQGCSTLIT